MSIRTALRQNSGTLTNQEALPLLTRMLAKDYKTMDMGASLAKAFAIYGKIDSHKNNAVMNVMLKLCLHFKDADRVQSMWPDIVQHEQNKMKAKSYKDSLLSYTLLLTCCLRSTHCNSAVDQCIAVLSWMSSNGYKLTQSDAKDYSYNLAQLISQCDDPRHLHALQTIHSLVDAKQLRNDVFLYHALIQAYEKCTRDYPQSLQVFESMTHEIRNAFCVSGMMQILLKYSRCHEVLSLFDTYQALTDSLCALYALKACMYSNDYKHGHAIIVAQLIHDDTNKNSHKHKNIQNACIDFYAYFGRVDPALQIFNSIAKSDRDCVSVASLMKAYVRSKQYIDAVQLFEQYTHVVDKGCAILALKCCIHMKDACKGEQIIASLPHSTRKNGNELNNCLIEFYAHFGDMDSAWQRFEQTSVDDRNAFTLNAMLKAYVHNQRRAEALALYHAYAKITDDVSHILAIKAAIQSRDWPAGTAIYQQIRDHKSRIPELNNALIDLHGLCGDVDTAEEIFNAMDASQKDFICLNTMMKVYIENELVDKALLIYDAYGSLQNGSSHILAIKACGLVRNFEKGKSIHLRLANSGKEHSLQLLNTLITFYGHCNDIANASQIFDAIPNSQKDIVTINAMLEAFCCNEMYADCMQLFEEIEVMYQLTPDIIGTAIVLEACARDAALECGRRIYHALEQDENRRWMLSATQIQTKLIAMYGKCGMLSECERIFSDIEAKEPEKYASEIELWNAMINAYAKNGISQKAQQMYEDMRTRNGLKPNSRTFAVLMNGLSHSGDIQQAKHIWETEIEQDDIKFDWYVVTSLIDGMSRKGMLKDAYEMVQQYNFDHQPIWLSLLSGCRTYQNKRIARMVYDQIKKKYGNDLNAMYSANMLIDAINNNS